MKCQRILQIIQSLGRKSLFQKLDLEAKMKRTSRRRLSLKANELLVRTWRIAAAPVAPWLGIVARQHRNFCQTLPLLCCLGSIDRIGSILFSVLEQPLGNDQDSQISVTLLLRNLFGRHVWTSQIRYSLRNKCGLNSPNNHPDRDFTDERNRH